MEMKNLCYTQSVLDGGAPIISKLAAMQAFSEIGLYPNLTDCWCHGIAQPLTRASMRRSPCCATAAITDAKTVATLGADLLGLTLPPLPAGASFRLQAVDVLR